MDFRFNLAVVCLIGGMGDEDEHQPENNLVWKKYFLRPYDEVERVVCTDKANGEAAHLSARYMGEQAGFVLFVGSKNVHMAVRRREDVEKYQEDRYRVAREVGYAVFDLLESMTPQGVSGLLSLLHHLRLTAVFEVLQPTYQHVVNLSHLSSSQLKFIAFVSAYGDGGQEDSYCDMAPETGFRVCGRLGVPTVGHTVVSVENVDHQMELVRRGHGTEGQVFYFVGKNNTVIGLLKKKTAWYVMARAIREQVSNAATSFNKTGNIRDASKLHDRLCAIQTWLGITVEARDKWIDLGSKFLAWSMDRLKEGKA